jgi:hypothetical protein
MKKSIFLILCLSLFISFSAWSQTNKVTWMDTGIDGAEMSSTLKGLYSNFDLDGTKPINGIIQKSQATEACKAIGGRLPTKKDFIKFENALRLNEKEIPVFWSSQVNPQNQNLALVLNVNIEGFFYNSRDMMQYRVRCIRP